MKCAASHQQVHNRCAVFRPVPVALYAPSLEREQHKSILGIMKLWPTPILRIFMDIQSLSPPERILLAEQLWESVRTESNSLSLTEPQVQILENRLAALATDGDLGDSWGSVRKRILAN